MSRIKKYLLQVAILMSFLAALGFWFCYFSLYWPYRNKFDQNGQYFDESMAVIYHQQTGLLIVPAIILSLMAIVLLVVFWRNKGVNQN